MNGDQDTTRLQEEVSLLREKVMAYRAALEQRMKDHDTMRPEQRAHLDRWKRAVEVLRVVAWIEAALIVLSGLALLGASR